MKPKHAIKLVVVAVVALALVSITFAQPRSDAARTPSSLSPNELTERTIHRRAVEAVIWGMPSGQKTYRLNVPANAPVKLYWSATAYDRETHALIRETSRSSRGSNSADVQKNADGSVDVYFAAQAPAGKESNWISTNGRDFEVLFRFYGPEKAFADKTWVLPDIEEVK